MKKTTIVFSSLLILSALCGVVYAGTESPYDSGVQTNIYFCKMVNVNGTYELQPLATRYTGENDYGRYTFVSVSNDLEAGDYAIVQNTSKGIELIRSVSLTPSGTPVPEYVMLTLELTNDDLPEPLEILQDQAGSPALTPLPTTPDLNAGTSVSPASPASQVSPAAQASAAPSATKSPGSLSVVLIGLGISGIVLHTFRRQ